MSSEDQQDALTIWDLIPYAGVFEAAPASEAVDDALSEASFVSAVLTFESMVAHAQGRYGVLPESEAVAAAHAIRRAAIDPNEVRFSMSRHATPIIELVDQVRRQVGPALADRVHVGLTSQDCIDTAHGLMQAAAIDRITPILGQLLDRLPRIAASALEVPMLARTLGQAAAPTTLGYKICGWISGLEAAYAGMLETRSSLALQLGGAVGDLRGQGDQAVQLAAAVADALELSVPRMPWHTERSRVLRAATSYVVTINACAKVATDVIAMQTPEVGEVLLGADPQQADRGGSSAMPHKRNPAAAVQIRSAAVQAPGLLSSVAAAAVAPHERAAGEWQAEWRPVRELLHLAGGAVSELTLLIGDLRFDPVAMARNLDAAEVGRDTGAAVARAREYLARFTGARAENE